MCWGHAEKRGGNLIRLTGQIGENVFSHLPCFGNAAYIFLTNIKKKRVAPVRFDFYNAKKRYKGKGG